MYANHSNKIEALHQAQKSKHPPNTEEKSVHLLWHRHTCNELHTHKTLNIF